MGNSLSNYCCNNNNNNTDSNNNQDKSNQKENIDKLIYGKMTLNNLLYHYDYKNIRVSLVKTKDLQEFFNSKSLLKVLDKKEINNYYDKILLTNFLDINETTFSIMEFMQNSTKESLSLKDIQKTEKNSYSINYYIENIIFKNINNINNDRIETSKNFYELIMNNIK